ncbi:hypothetical protein [Larkinella humicola]|nr:hypothetical protein [Larkinella humicola]
MKASLKALLCAVAMTGFFRVEAQQNRFLGISAGVAPLQIKDQFHSPYTYRGTGLNLQATFGQERTKTQWQLDAGYTQANPQSVVSRKASTRLFDLILNYHWRLFPASQPENRLQYFGGVGLRLFGNATNYSPDSEVATVQATAAISLGASARVSYRLNPVHRLQIQAFASVVSVVYRPDYDYNGKEHLAASWLGKSPILALEASYQYRFSKKYQATCRYQMNYFRYDQPRSVLWLGQSVSMGIQRSF